MVQQICLLTVLGRVTVHLRTQLCNSDDIGRKSSQGLADRYRPPFQNRHMTNTECSKSAMRIVKFSVVSMQWDYGVGNQGVFHLQGIGAYMGWMC